MANKLKRNIIQLVSNVKEVQEKDAEPKFDIFLTPHFIPTSLWYETIDVMEEVEEIEYKANKDAEAGKRVSQTKLMKDQMELLQDVVIKIYGQQFTKEQLLAGLHAPSMIEDLRDQVAFIARGQQDEATKKFVENKS